MAVQQKTNPFAEVTVKIKSREKIKIDLQILQDEILDKKLLVAFTDGSSLANLAGAGILILYEEGNRITKKELSISLNEGTNNYAETKALLYAVKELRNMMKDRTFTKIKIYCPSVWLSMTVSKNWETKYHTADLDEIYRLLLQMKKGITLELWWVPAHSDYEFNETVDRLAKQAARRTYRRRRKEFLENLQKKRKIIDL